MLTFIREMSIKVSVFTGTIILTCAIVFLSETITIFHAIFIGVSSLKVALVLGALVPAVLCPPVYAIVLISLKKLNKAQEERDKVIEHLQIARTQNEKVIEELKGALAKVKQLSGLLPICSSCKKIRDDKGYWNQIEAYIRDHSEAEFSHGICPECSKKLYPDLGLNK